MRISDQVTGGAMMILGAATVYGGSLLPPIPGQQVGPSVFPMLTGGLLVLAGLFIVFGAGRHAEEEAEADLAAMTDEVAASAPQATGPLHGLRALVPPILLFFYALISDRIGFVPAAAVVIFIAAVTLGAKLRLAIPLALIAPVFVHLVFAKLLRVALPPGLLPMPW